MGAHCAVLDVVIPSKVPARSVRIAPGHHEHRQAVLDRKPDEGIGRLEVQNIELIDAGWHDQQGPGCHLLRRRFILNELKEIVLEHGRASGSRDVLSDRERALVRERLPLPRSAIKLSRPALRL